MEMEKSDLQKRCERRLPPPPKVAPWLVFPHGKDGKFQTFYNLCGDDQLNKRASKKCIPELSKRSFWQKSCHRGWLVIVCQDDDTDPNYGDCLLWNPQSLETIHLPSLPKNEINEYLIKDGLLTSPPQTSTSISSRSSSRSSGSSSSSSSDSEDYDEDSMVYLLFDCRLESPDFLLFCHPGEKQWRKHVFDFVEFTESMVYLKNKLHIMCWNGFYLEVEIQHGSDFDDEETLAVRYIQVCLDGISRESLSGGLGRTFNVFYVESFGDVFRIFIASISRGIHQSVSQIGIVKLDFSSMAWVSVKSLDDHVLFLSSCTRLSCLASDLGYSKGCMYYTQLDEMSLYKYDLEDQSISLSLPCPDLPTPWFLPQWLMITTPPRVDDSKTTNCIMGKGEHMDKVIEAMENIAGLIRDDEKEDTEEGRLGIMPIDDLVWSVSNYLHTLDYLHLRAVSKRYRAVMNLKRSSSTRTFKTTDLSPWLVFSDYDRSIYNFVNPLHNNEKYLISIPEMVRGSRICFSKGGWLLMVNGLTLFFHNPFTKSTIKLPDFPDNDDVPFSGISFSSLPTSADCVVFAINKELNASVSIFFIKRGEEHWRHDSFDATSYLPLNRKQMGFDMDWNNPVFYNGAFYCLDINGNLGVSKQENGNVSWEVLAMVTRPNCGFIYKSYLVECEGKLLCVLLGHLGKWVRIFGLNDTQTAWVEVKDLGRHMLCVSNTSCISAVAPVSEMENKIYFPRFHEDGILFFSLDTGMYHCVGTTRHSAKDYRDTKVKLYCSWIEPNWSETSVKSLDWLSI